MWIERALHCVQRMDLVCSVERFRYYCETLFSISFMIIKTIKLKNSESLLYIRPNDAGMYELEIEVNIFMLIPIFANGKEVSLSLFKLQS